MKIEPVDITVESSGNGWMGTFGIVIRTLVDDILSDGKPFEARITYELEGTSTIVEVKVISLAGPELEVSEWGRIYHVEIEDIRKFEA